MPEVPDDVALMMAEDMARSANFLTDVAGILFELGEVVCSFCDHDPNAHAKSCPIGKLVQSWDRWIVPQ